MSKRVKKEIKIFTLIELLVVIAIISILASMLMPSLKNAIKSARGTACLSNHKQIGQAIAIYAADWKNFVPVGFSTGSDHWRVRLYGYTNNSFDTFNCTEDLNERHLIENETELADQHEGSIGVLFQSANNYKEYAEYYDGSMQWLSSNNYVYQWPLNRGWANPSRNVYIADAYRGNGAATYPSTHETSNGTSSINAPSYTNAGESTGYGTTSGPRFADRHNGTNSLFLDGRAALLNTFELVYMSQDNPDYVWNVSN